MSGLDPHHPPPANMLLHGLPDGPHQTVTASVICRIHLREHKPLQGCAKTQVPKLEGLQVRRGPYIYIYMSGVSGDLPDTTSVAARESAWGKSSSLQCSMSPLDRKVGRAVGYRFGEHLQVTTPVSCRSPYPWLNGSGLMSGYACSIHAHDFLLALKHNLNKYVITEFMNPCP